MPVNLGEILHLERPLAVMDFETTGLLPATDRIVQMAITIHYPKREPIAWDTLVNPGAPISPGSTRVHKITDAMVKDAPTFAEIAPALAPKMMNLDIAGYNVEFDLQFLRAEMKRANIVWDWSGFLIDALQIYRRLKPHSLQEAFREYVNPTGFENPHNAANDVSATAYVLDGQLKKYPNLPKTVEELSKFCYPNKTPGLDQKGKLTWAGEYVVMTFGKWKNTPLHLVDVAYLQWCMGADFADDFKAILAEAIIGNYPRQGNKPPEETVF